jgi:hypothetical protein
MINISWERDVADGAYVGLVLPLQLLSLFCGL